MRFFLPVCFCAVVPYLLPQAPAQSSSPAPPPAAVPDADPSNEPRPTISLDPSDLEGFQDLPETTRKMLAEGLELAGRSLAYRFGSNDPAAGGMDCSGFVHYLLSRHGYETVPRQSDRQYVWVRKAGNFRAVLSSEADTFELDDLESGDLMFWTGTYDVEREFPVTHVMLYLGRAKEDGRRLMIGASEGRTFNGISRYGVSVFDFRLPRRSKERHSDFVGYGSPPER